MEFDKLPEGGSEVSVAGYKGIVTRLTKVAGGIEVTVQLNDEDDETPVSGLGAFSAANVKEEEETPVVSKPAVTKPVATTKK